MRKTKKEKLFDRCKAMIFEGMSEHDGMNIKTEFQKGISVDKIEISITEYMTFFLDSKYDILNTVFFPEGLTITKEEFMKYYDFMESLFEFQKSIINLQETFCRTYGISNLLKYNFLEYKDPIIEFVKKCKGGEDVLKNQDIKLFLKL